MFLFNQAAARDLRIKLSWNGDCTFTHDGTPAVNVLSAEVQIPYGVQYSPNFDGFGITIGADDSTSPDTWETTVDIVTPGSDYSSGALTGIQDQDIWVYVDEYELTVDAECDAWSFTAAKVGFYSDEARAFPLLELTSFSDSGTAFDRRETVTKWDVTAQTSDMPYADVNLTGVLGCDHVDINLRSEFVECYWEHRWTGDTEWTRPEIRKTEQTLPDAIEQDCGLCVESLPTITVHPDDPLKWAFSLEAVHDLYNLAADEVCYDQPCPEDSPLATMRVCYQTVEGHWSTKASTFRPAWTGGGIPDRENTTRVWTGCCVGFPDLATEGPNSASSSITYCWLFREVGHAEWQDVCSVRVDGLACAGGVIELPDLPQSCCYYAASSLVDWVQPGCDNVTGAWVSRDVAPDKRHVEAFDSGANVILHVEDVDMSVLRETDLGFAADWGCVRWAKNRSPVEIHLFTQEGTGIKRRVSTDGGATFGAATTIGTGMYPTAAVHQDGTEFAYWISAGDIVGKRFDRDGNALETQFTAVAGVDDAGIAANVETTTVGTKRVVLSYFVSGVLTQKVSQDGITFA